MTGQLATLWTIRLALACYVAFVALRLLTPKSASRNSLPTAVARTIWTLGCGLFLVHVVCAFHFHHGWSHAAAWEKTAAETDKLLGIRFGDGIFFSYAFTVLWLLDVAAMWLWPQADGALRLVIHAYLFFIAFNGAIVFEAGPIRWVGVAACILLAGLAARAAYNWAAGRACAGGRVFADLHPEPRGSAGASPSRPTTLTPDPCPLAPGSWLLASVRMSRPLKIAYLTAGAAGMICGSCLHDNTLARALGELGHDVQLIPLYTPIRTDEQDMTSGPVFYGGINMYLQQKAAVFRWLPKWLDRWLDQPWLINWASGGSVKIDPHEVADLTLSILRGREGFQRKEVERLAEWLAADRPDVIVFSNILTAGCVPEVKRRLNVPIVVTLQGDDIFLRELPQPHRDQALAEIGRLAGQIDGFIAHSQYYADHMAEYLGIPRERIDVVPLGIDTRDFEREGNAPAEPGFRVQGSGFSSSHSAIRNPQSAIPTIGYLARLDPAKGLHVLAEAFIRLRQLPGMEAARLKIAGWLGGKNKEYAESVFARLRTAGLGEAFEYVGEVDRRGKLDFLAGLDVLAVPTTYREPKGLFVLEALAAGVPVVQPEHGAFPELLAELGGGVLHRPEDPEHLAERLREMLVDAHKRAELAQTGRQRVLSGRNERIMAERTVAVLGQLTERRLAGPAASQSPQETVAQEVKCG